MLSQTVHLGHDYTIGTLDVLQACDACADMGMTYSVILQCTDCVIFPHSLSVLVAGDLVQCRCLMSEQKSSDATVATLDTHH